MKCQTVSRDQVLRQVYQKLKSPYEDEGTSRSFQVAWSIFRSVRGTWKTNVVMLDGIPVTRVNYELVELLECPRKRVQRNTSRSSRKLDFTERPCTVPLCSFSYGVFRVKSILTSPFLIFIFCWIFHFTHNFCLIEKTKIKNS